MGSVASQLFFNSIIAGSIYALVASGFSLIYSTNKFMHFAHGVSVVVGAYLLYTFYLVLGVPFILAVVLTVLLTGLFGLLLYCLLYVPLQNRGASNVVLLIASIATLILFQNLVQLLYGANFKNIGYVTIGRGTSILGAIITPLQIFIVAVALLLAVLLYLFMKKTKLGRNMRAVADNKELARVIGINDRSIAGYSFLIGSCLAGIAGILVGLEQNLHPSMGTTLMVKGFTGAVIGGVTSVPGSVMGSWLLGLAENLGVWFLPSGYKDAIGFVLLFFFLLLRPAGLFGFDKGVKT